MSPLAIQQNINISLEEKFYFLLRGWYGLLTPDLGYLKTPFHSLHLFQQVLNLIDYEKIGEIN